MILLFLRRYWTWLAIAAAIVVISLTYQHCSGPSELSPKVRDSLAVLTASKTPDSIAHAATVAKAETVLVESAALSVVSRRAERAAKKVAALADSLAAQARLATTARDSAEKWRGAYEAEHRRGDSLQVALDTANAATAKAEASALEFKRADSLSQFRLARVERLNASLVSEAERISAGCRLLPFVRCPTRKETAAAAVVVTYLVVDQIKKQRDRALNSPR